MSTSEIVVGGTYANAQGAQRKVLRFTNNRAQKGAHDHVLYRVVRGRAQGREYTCRLTTFARWATERVRFRPGKP